MAWTERTKPTDSWTERAFTGGPGYDFSMTNIFWDRTDIYFDNTTAPVTERTKPSDGEIERTKPTGGWLELDGNGYATIADASQTGLDMGLSDFMVEMRVKLTVPTANQPAYAAYFFSKYLGLVYYDIFLDRADEDISLSIGDGINVNYTTCSSSYVDDLEWHSLIFSVDKDDATGLEIYVDGAEATYIEQFYPAPVGDLDNTSELTVGIESFAHSLPLVGSIDEVRVWNFGVDGLPADYADYITWRNANPNASTSDYNGGSWNTYITNNLSAYYKFDGDYLDETDNDNDLTAGGSGNSLASGWTERTKPTNTATERTKPT